MSIVPAGGVGRGYGGVAGGVAGGGYPGKAKTHTQHITHSLSPFLDNQHTRGKHFNGKQ